jgi:hypothetical protein
MKKDKNDLQKTLHKKLRSSKMNPTYSQSLLVALLNIDITITS